MPFATQYNVMVPLQAKNWDEFDTILKTALDYDVSSVALPKLLGETLGMYGRLIGAEKIRNISDVPIHALGCTDHLVEAKYLANQGIVRGIDSAAPIVHALEGYLITDPAVKRPDNYFFIKEYSSLVEVNIDDFRAWCEKTSTSQV
jgi:hypothetical protein